VRKAVREEDEGRTGDRVTVGTVGVCIGVPPCARLFSAVLVRGPTCP
jgi:hypothetical protein